MLKNKDKLIDIICFVLAPTILGGVLLEGHIEDAQASFGTFAVALIMLGIVRGKWKREGNKK